MPVLPLCSVLRLLLSSVIVACQTPSYCHHLCPSLTSSLDTLSSLDMCFVCLHQHGDTVSLISDWLKQFSHFFFSKLNWLLKFSLCSIFYWLLKWIIAFVHFNLFCAGDLPYRWATPTAARLSCLTALQWRQEAKLEEVRILMKCQWGT